MVREFFPNVIKSITFFTDTKKPLDLTALKFVDFNRRHR